VIDAAHRVEEMRRGSGTRRVSGDGLAEGRRGMADGGCHAAIREPSDEVDRTRQLGRDGEQPKAVEQPFHRRAGGVGGGQQVGRVVRPASVCGEERSLQVEPERLGPVGWGMGHPGADAVGEGAEIRERRGHRGRQE